MLKNEIMKTTLSWATSNVLLKENLFCMSQVIARALYEHFVDDKKI